MPAPETPICDYEGSDYQASFWDTGRRAYEDGAEAVALRRLLPPTGELLLELGAGAGRNTPRYAGFRRIVLLDFSISQLEQAQMRLGTAERYTYVAADVYNLPFAEGIFDAATMIRVLHHMKDPPKALSEVRNVLKPHAVFILEFANKRNTKSILRYWLGLQRWNPFSKESVEFAKLNFDFHPDIVRSWLEELGFRVQRTLTVSHFRAALLKKVIPTPILVFLDSVLQPTGRLWQYTPSVFLQARGGNPVPDTADAMTDAAALFKCPACGGKPLDRMADRLACRNCRREWGIAGGIYDFRRPMEVPVSGHPD